MEKKTQKQEIEELKERVERLEQLLEETNKKVSTRNTRFISNMEKK